MRFIEEFRNRELAQKLIRKIERYDFPATFMEVCGTHTVSLFRFGIREMLPKRIKIISGPGCPVCVTSQQDIERALTLASLPNTIFLTFGDMMKVPAKTGSLEKKRAEGADIRVVYSPLDALKIAKENPTKLTVFLAVGFETTAPGVASAILRAKEEGINNFKVLSLHKLIPPAMRAILDMGEINIQGFICPGHVSTIIGAKAYRFIPEEYGIPCVIAGFEPLDILQSIYMLMDMLENKRADVEIQYKRVVSEEGNPRALEIMERVFEPKDAVWRGLGYLPGTALGLKDEFAEYDAENLLEGLDIPVAQENPRCLCGEVIRGVKEPEDCPLYKISCTPLHPIGPCMVSSEGTCAAHYKYS
ncbi:hydrogenase formation protein HypD [bacterium]|nr:hydrogenase formation protein HypD [bacterium]